MKTFNVGHRANFKDKLTVNLHLLFPVRLILRGTVIPGEAPDVTADHTRARCEIFTESNLMVIVALA